MNGLVDHKCQGLIFFDTKVFVDVTFSIYISKFIISVSCDAGLTSFKLQALAMKKGKKVHFET